MPSTVPWAVVALTIFSSSDAQKISKTGRCGAKFGLTCHGSSYGNCCSQYEYCGSIGAYCGAGCNDKFGKCSSSSSSVVRSSTGSTSTSSRVTSSNSASIILVTPTRSSSSNTPSSTLKVTPSDRCGKGFGFTCQGSKWGDCCSQYSYCGLTKAYCGDGCQQGFGKCNLVSSPSSPRPISSSISSSTRQTSSSTTLSSTSTSQSSTTSQSSSTILALSSSISTSESVSSIQIASSTSTVVPSSSTGSSTLSTVTIPDASPTPSLCPAPVNLAVNPGFETGLVSPWVVQNAGNQWGITVSAIDGHSSSRYLSGIRLGGMTPVGYSLTQSFILAQTTTIDVSMWIRLTNTVTGQARFNVYIDNLGLGSITNLRGGEGWQKHTAGQKTLSSGIHSITIQCGSAGGPIGLETGIDDITIQIIDPAGASPSCVTGTSTSSAAPEFTG
ncbi:carbohydrate-binding module family 18 protein [Cucurbitaria berberidis CBS 394.84]|uniref:Carbohydrate-binding module family 18 protein n=1 Tax=Cucurbitaria berberidis CBS 394.84 TaxID=1168544 RepID=A0A9P4LBU3_9PLEO|nr:carbohydrate-binding module family 18 protein [Cucurbitaria berberidis CBS 394.84]KAF1848707.1 carbohydrate-binding module family 18 protein [Cucurbitaria berberidis CBS 394.84]